MRRLRVSETQSPFAAGALARALPAAAAGLATLVGAGFLPFFPAGWAIALALAATLTATLRPRAGLALALAAPILPLGNLSLGLAILYGSVAMGWLALSWRDSRSGLLFLTGPLLAPLGLLALAPLAVQPARSAGRRGLQAFAAVVVAALAAGLRGAPLPFGATASAPALAGLESPVAAARALLGALPPTLGLAALACAAIAVAIPWATSVWRIAILGAAALTALLLLAPAASAAPLVAAIWLTCAALTARHERQTRSD